MSEFNKIIGYEDEKEELKRLCDILKNTEKYTKLGVEKPTALLIHGEPGLGKTLMAKCFVKESGRNVFECKKSKQSGNFVEEINKVFSLAVENQPSIILLDDMDKFAEDNFSANSNKDEFVTIQNWLDEIKNKDVFVIATANKIRFLPSSLLRVGRFGRQMKIDVPNIKDATKIIEYYVKNKNLADNVNPKKIAMLINGQSCVVLENIINEAGIYAGYKNQKQIDFEDIIKAFLRVVFKGVENKSSDDKTTKIIRAYHEAGHAVLSMIIGKEVGLLMVKKYGDVEGGCLDFNTKKISTIFSLRREVLSLLAGRASVEIQFGFADIGAGHDLQRAESLLKEMVVEYASSGFNYFYNTDTFSSERDPKLLSRVSDYVHFIFEKYYQITKLILLDNKKLLDELASELVNEEILFYDKIEEIKNKNELNFSNYTKEFYYM